MRNRVRKCRNNNNNNNNNTSNDNNLSENSNKKQGKKKLEEEEEQTLLQCNEYSDANIYNRLKDAIRSMVFILVRTIATVYNFSFSVCVSKVPTASALSDMVKKRQTAAAAAAASEARETASSTDSGEEELLNGHHHHHHPRHHHQYQTGNNATVCPHVKKSVDTARLRRQLKATGLLFECGQCPKLDEMNGASGGDESDNTLWLCLKCGTQLCGRARNQHALQHHQKPHSDSHAIALNTRTFKIWCYSCDQEVNAKSRKNLLECVELVKRLAQKPPKLEPPVINNIEYKIKSALEQMSHMVPLNGATNAAAIPLPPPPPAAGSFGSVPGMAKRITDVDPSSRHLERLPRVRGLTNLGNTCFFNAVMQCLAQTPFLLAVLKELAEPGEEFVLPGGTFNFKEKGDIELPTIKGTLSSWGNLTAALANALEELQSGGGVFTPSKLFDRLCAKCPQFTGGDQHDAHELLRQLLESVRSEDLQRYQRVILQNLGYQDINSVSEELRQKCKIYGNQAADRILRPEQVFRGFLVSTLTCQDCFNVSSRHEYFLDMSLPVAVEKPQPPQRRKTSPENSPPAASTSTAAANFSNNSTGGSINAKFSNGDTDVIFTEHSSFYLHHDQQEQLGPSKAQVKKEKERERKAKRAAKHQRTKAAQKLSLHTTTNNSNNHSSSSSSNASSSTTSSNSNSNNTSSSTISSSNNSTTGAGDHYHGNDEEREQQPGTAWGEGQRADTLSLSATTSEHSDADVEDNVAEDNAAKAATAATVAGAGRSAKYYKDSNGNAQHMDKDSLEEDENDSGIATSPAPTTATATAAAAVAVNKETEVAAADDNNDDEEEEEEASTAASLVNAGLSEEGASIIRELSSGQLTQQMEQLSLREQAQNVARLKRVRTQSYSDWSTTIAPRYQCDVGECSVPSCLNNFSAVELMTGQNKVGCESCTRRINGPDPQAKSVNTNATKQLLISSPPAVLILHLKRFQLGPRCVFRKLTRPVTYTVLLDIAAFCGSKVKNLPNIDRKQKKLLYALYGVVEHSGGLYGGHYTAYVKVRPKVTPDDKRWKFLPHGSKAELDQDDEQLKKLEESLVKSKAREMRRKAMDDSDDFTSSSNGSTSDEAAADLLLQNGTNDATTAPATATPATPTPAAAPATGEAATTEADEAANVQAPPGKWYYVSDSRVQEVSEEEALKAQAYLLFYERIY